MTKHHVNFFALSGKCFWSCLECHLPTPLDQKSILRTITLSGRHALNIFSHTTLELATLTPIRQAIKQHRQRLAFFYQGKVLSQLLAQNPDLLLFPFFSLEAKQHDSFCGSTSFYQQISDMNHLPKTIKRRVVFFLGKDNFSEGTDLDTFAYSNNTLVWIIPYSLFSPHDFDIEDYLYLKRLTRYKTLFIHPLHLEFIKKEIEHKNCCYLLRADLTPASLLQSIETHWFYYRLFG
ncbi:MAG: hypothetical protein AABZ14_05050 [Candidatus Margulisiibacteriota bacterium]